MYAHHDSCRAALPTAPVGGLRESCYDESGDPGPGLGRPMASIAYRRWSTVRAKALDEMTQAHVALGGTSPGRRYATQQVNQAYAVLLASQFQGVCRDLHMECVGHLLRVLAPPPALNHRARLCDTAWMSPEGAA
jgi:hypothetical protein